MNEPPMQRSLSEIESAHGHSDYRDLRHSDFSEFDVASCEIVAPFFALRGTGGVVIPGVNPKGTA